MVSRQIDVFRVRKQDVAELKVSARLDARRRLEMEDRLQTLDARLDVGRARRAEILGQAEQRKIPSVLRRRHFNISPTKPDELYSTASIQQCQNEDAYKTDGGDTHAHAHHARQSETSGDAHVQTRDLNEVSNL